ncbi:MAG TPA: tetratricopeptide repeat protein [Candidatus Limnocylindrales bacterium]|nr:tetratricopeptide repeat protein [Candidatus Limnocylindrales bacterium]
MTDVESQPVPGAKPVGTVTFLFTDIEGSTRLAQSLPLREWTEVLARHRTLIRGAIQSAGGHEEKTEGDGIFAVFERVDQGVAAAVEAQRRLAAEAWPDGVEVNVRMGLHTGDGALDADDEYVGADVHRAARVAGAGHGGQVLLSQTAASLVFDSLPTGVELRDLGEHRLKDLRPERICQLTIDGLRAEFPPIRSIDSRPNNLPTQLTSFVGREAELAEASRLLESTRLLTLTGPGGTGKTRLSLQLAADVADRYPGGTFFVPLEPVRDPAFVASAIASAIGLVESGARSPRDVVVEWIGDRRVLLVLDNFEQVIDGAPVVGELLRSCPNLAVIATSRAPLRVSGEQEYPVPGLPVPLDILALSELQKLNLQSGERSLAAESITQYEAVRLFIARAVAVRPDFAVTNDNAPAVAGICARLHGMPLAIELAAARVKLLQPDAILQRLEHQLNLLASGSRDVPERQQTLRGAIAWSHDLLDAGERRLFARLAVFVGGCDLATAERVCGPAQDVGVDILDGLMSLADQSLVKSEEVDGETRFRQLDTIREFAAERLAADGEQAEIEGRHTAAFLALAEEAAPHLSGADQRLWLGRLERDHDNIRAVLARATAAADAGVACRLGFAMWRYWQKRGHLAEAARRLDAIAREPWSRSDKVLRAKLMEAVGGVAWWQADPDRMSAAYGEALALWREIGDKREIANALYNASFQYAINAERHNPDPTGEGMAMMTEALALYREVGDERGIANVLWGMGNIDYFAAAGDQGIAEFREALEIFERVGDRTMAAWSQHMLGSSLLRLGRFDEAGPILRQAIRLFHDAGDVSGLTLVLDDLASEAIGLGDLQRGARLWGAARAVSSAGGVGLADMIDTQFEIYHRPNVAAIVDRAELEQHAAEGRTMSIDESVAYALEMPVEMLPGPHDHVGGTPG